MNESETLQSNAYNISSLDYFILQSKSKTERYDLFSVYFTKRINKLTIVTNTS